VTWLKKLAKGVPREGHVYQTGPWTVLKLLAVYYTVDFCVRIMAAPHHETGEPRQGFGSVVYIDLNAGSGLVGIKDTKAIVAGTALIGPGLSRENPTRAFDYHFLVEPDEGRANALELRLAALLPRERFRVIRKGADDAIDEIVPRLVQTNANFVAVFDPYGFQEGSEKSWARLLGGRRRGDLISTFQTKLATRHTARTITPVIGAGILDGLEDSHLTTSEALEAFRTSVKRHRPVVRDVRIRAGDTGYFYDVLYATRASRTGEDWAGAFDRVKAKLEALDGTRIRTMLKYRTLERGLGDF
jgi:three-Cys-motif partner protein